MFGKLLEANSTTYDAQIGGSKNSIEINKFQDKNTTLERTGFINAHITNILFPFPHFDHSQRTFFPSLNSNDAAMPLPK